jgi:putative intracellular protease/amidase
MAVLAYPDVQILDVVGPLQVFSNAGYPVEIVGIEAGPVRTSSGMQLVAPSGAVPEAAGWAIAVQYASDGGSRQWRLSFWT